jgi:hypothetical protein
MAVSGGLRIRARGIAFSKMIGDLIACAPFPLLGLRQPESPMLGVVRCALPAYEFLIANLNQLVHELHSSGVKPRAGPS